MQGESNLAGKLMEEERVVIVEKPLSGDNLLE